MSNEKATTDHTDDVRSVFVISPIGAAGTPESIKAQAVLDYIIRQALTLPKWDVIRADEEADSGSITHKVIERIATSDLIVADLTDHNPNVFYELAVAHGYNKPVVNLMTDGQRMPFDIVDQRAVFYDLTDPGSVHRAKSRLANAAENALAPEAKLTNPLAGYKLFADVPNEAGGAAPNGAKLEYALDTIMARLGRIESEIVRDPDLGRHIQKPTDGGLMDRSVRYLMAASEDAKSELQKLGSSLARELDELNRVEDPTPKQLHQMNALQKKLMTINFELDATRRRAL
ncbi:hypothetical protein R4P64_07790 [Rhodococcus sp. IEGM 1366]|uniref:hypothetical protein n=1 Tax=Rhodococcus sp. IEGM 1366 TaxID=3082223 RepID=UPI002954A4DC|nr:hypothetical protein [Rhodococcus sp. IEGM 1366]MDV8066402.1 hypothetical protein [Rhodococcus sp. IEGM 1366]